MYRQYFTIENFPNDVYLSVGKIIHAAQEWERDFKKLANMLNLSIKNIDKSSLNKLNDTLKTNHQLNEKDYNNLKEVIKLRNYVNHTFFLEKFNGNREDLQTFLNDTQHLIYEATDVINNRIDELNGCSIKRPTVFD